MLLFGCLFGLSFGYLFTRLIVRVGFAYDCSVLMISKLYRCDCGFVVACFGLIVFIDCECLFTDVDFVD